MFGLTNSELFPFLSMLILVGIVLFHNYFKGFREFWSPLTVLAIILSYYCLLGPYEAVASGRFYDRLVNMRPHYAASLWGGFVFFSSVILGYQVFGKRRAHSQVRIKIHLLKDYGLKMFAVGLIMFTISSRGNILRLLNPLEAETYQQVGGSFSNYFLLCVNFLIPASTLLLSYYLATKKGLIWLILGVIIAIGLFTTLGFRYRLILLLGSLVATYYLTQRKKPNLILIAIAGYYLITVMGAINISRQYSRGLKVEELEEKSISDYYQSGLSESRIFQTSGAVINYVPEKIDYAGLQPLVSTILFPVPRLLYPEKNSDQYLVDVLSSIYGKVHYKGAAYLNYAEYYLAFGWVGIFFGGFLIGWFYRKLWNWYLTNYQNPFAITTYAVSVVYLYIIISRGYLPQVVMLYFFSAFPIYIVLRLSQKRTRSTYVKTLSVN